MTIPNAKPRAGEHTKGPWKIGYSDGSGCGENGEGFYIVAPNSHPVVRGGLDDWGIPKGIDLEANARRIVAAVNAAEGLSIEFLEQCEPNKSTLDFAAQIDALAAQNRELIRERDQQERFKWAGNKRIEELAAVLKQVADRLSAWRDGAHIAFNASGSDEQYNLRGNYDGLLSAIEAVMVETVPAKHGR